MTDLTLGAVIAGVLAGLMLLLPRPIWRILSSFVISPKTLRALRTEVGKREDALRNVRDLLFGLRIAECDLSKVRRAVNTRSQWRKPAIQASRLGDNQHVLRINRGTKDGVIPGMTVSFSRLSSGGERISCTLEQTDIEWEYSCIRVSSQFLEGADLRDIEASFIASEDLTHSEKSLADAVDLIESVLSQ